MKNLRITAVILYVIVCAMVVCQSKAIPPSPPVMPSVPSNPFGAYVFAVHNGKWVALQFMPRLSERCFTDFDNHNFHCEGEFDMRDMPQDVQDLVTAVKGHKR